MSNVINDEDSNDHNENNLRSSYKNENQNSNDRKRSIGMTSIEQDSLGNDSVSSSSKQLHRQVENGSNSKLQFGLTKIPSGSINKENQSILESLYQQNDPKLIELQNKLFGKKSILDSKKDEFEGYKVEFKNIQKKLDELREQKMAQHKELTLKTNELTKLQYEFESKKDYKNREQELKLKQVRAINKANLNRLSSEYISDLDKLRFEKVRKFEDEKEILSEKLTNLRNDILTQPNVFITNQSIARKEVDKNREIWNNALQQQIITETKAEIDMKNILESKKNLLELKLKEELSKLTEEVKLSQDKLKKLKENYHVNTEDSNQLKVDIAAKENEVLNTIEKNEQLKRYLENVKAEMIETNQILIKEETMRRVLHNRLQELRGNIRVFCRMRPPLPDIEDPDISNIKIKRFDNNYGTQSMKVTKENGESQIYKFDRIFDQADSNTEVFKEIGQLVQSSLDGHNVCIFAYGQTGSGKTYTMLNDNDGMIPATISHIFDWTESMKEKGWIYDISCQFIEIYNEGIIDLLRDNSTDGNEAGSPNKHEIRHDKETMTTSVTNINTIALNNKGIVNNVLKKATKLRATAATNSNERSSRSHSVFMIYLKGKNEITGDSSEGILNLVDLAGSERLNSSQAVGARLRETQNINKSLSCLGDVIHALGQNDNTKRHIPFRNSKLTYLLQYSLTGSSKTLMFVNISPTKSHLNETINSLRFASKVNSTKIGTKGN
ncbi:hypothetical protein TPHA_0D03200 [Tetrapisispora phaffii CBS 4417]|uniref:Kinesin motor domain-containing protein n=1 Tax=Tetrapisispora phaffii (strain ATCC 24235 / CBS 4417 / NBRC 1672 / NRRL Y-8282 / UCD 70-5) TaxID=1071381 RepID=G8BSY5_TETPH|nr:hypothetical protein TPHA_0D03200 [Tetrapisispora phaffii CBS 4417]CCE62956.1 hypothetical protein TPHA_0D03200 [Tetrapisispora phaffii CBS 4417]